MYDAAGAVADMMAIADATSDPIESFFGIHDSVASVQSKNTSFHVTGTLATWNHNCTSNFLNTLMYSHRKQLLLSAVWHGHRLKRETDAAISHAAAHKLSRLQKEAEANRKAEKNLIHDLLNLRSETLFKTVTQYEDFRLSVGDDDKKVVKELKKQIRILRKVLQ